MDKFGMETLVLGMIQTNVYVVSNAETKEAIVIDPADNAPRIEQYLNSNDLVCKAVLLTHGHFDHIMAAKDLADDTGVKIYAHEDEADFLKDPKQNGTSRTHKECSLIPDYLLKDGEVLQVAGFTIRVIHTPGHTLGSVCYYLPEHATLISGDTLFHGDIGITPSPARARMLVSSVLEKLMVLEDDIKVYPGHEEPTTIGEERENNLYLTHNYPFE